MLAITKNIWRDPSYISINVLNSLLIATADVGFSLIPSYVKSPNIAFFISLFNTNSGLLAGYIELTESYKA